MIPMLVAGSYSQVLTSRIARSTGSELASVEYAEFPDGEQLVRVPDIESTERAVIVASTPTDESYVELLQLVDACRDVSRVEVVLPYMGYSRQDKRFREGESVSARAVAQGLPPVDRVMTVNVHEPGVLDWFDAETIDLDASAELANGLESISNPLVVSPDNGAVDLAESLAGALGGEADYLEKTRLSGDEVEMKPKNLPVEDREVIVVDDMISTGGTMSEAIDILGAQGASTLTAACIHPVLARNAVLELYGAGVDNIVATDTLESVLSSVSVADLISRNL